MVRIYFKTKSVDETKKIWKMLKRYFVNAESVMTDLVRNGDVYCVGSTFQIEGSILDIFRMCLDIRKIPYRVKMLG